MISIISYALLYVICCIWYFIMRLEARGLRIVNAEMWDLGSLLARIPPMELGQKNPKP